MGLLHLLRAYRTFSAPVAAAFAPFEEAAAARDLGSTSAADAAKGPAAGADAAAAGAGLRRLFWCGTQAEQVPLL